VAVVLKDLDLDPASSRKILLMVQNKAASNSNNHHIKEVQLKPFRERVGFFRDRLQKCDALNECGKDGKM
jgi:hypothetical protein